MNKSPKKVAVIAIHGIADQKPNGSAQAISSLLTRILPKELGESHYEFSERTEIEVPVKELFKEDKKQNIKSFLERLKDLFDERGDNFKREIKKIKDNPEGAEDADHLFIKDQIYQHEVRGTYNIFRTQKISINCQKVKKDFYTDTPFGIDIYEMYWADLSRLGEGFISIVGNFYQLLFHLTSLGRQCIDYARYNHFKPTSHSPRKLSFFWLFYSYLQALAARILTLVIPVLNIFILISSLSCLPTWISQKYIMPTFILSYELLFFGIIFGIIFYLKIHLNNCLFVILSSISLSLTLLFAYFFTPWIQNTWLSEFEYIRLISLLLILILGVLAYFVFVKPYDRHRKGTEAVFWILAAFFLVVAVTCLFCLDSMLWSKNSDLITPTLTLSSLRIMEILYIALFAFWGLLLLCYFVAYILGVLLIYFYGKGKYQIYRTTWTARVSLALPITLFSLLTPSLWIIIAYAGRILWPHYCYHSLLFKQFKPEMLPKDFALALAFLPGLGIRFQFFVLVSILIVSLVFAFLPSQLYEDGQILANKDIDKDKKTETEKSESLGNWLNTGFGVMAIGIEIFLNFLIPFLLIVKFLQVFFIHFLQFCPKIQDILLQAYSHISILIPSWIYCLLPDHKLDSFSSPEVLQLPVLISGILVASLIAFQKFLWGFLDLILDVDNYLRSRPVDDTPTGRIFARYSSLLREICKSNKYCAIVIVAHSQGTVITADLLRFLEKEKENLKNQELEKLQDHHIYLFTMGSPLRQLYNFGFPILYDWVEDAESKFIKNNQKDPKLPIYQFDDLPENLLSVRKWVNAYRSGDYVGRYIWRSSNAPDLWTPIELKSMPAEKDIKREEFCIGVGAHNHYWDEHALEIAKKLDKLIRQSISEK